MHFIARNAALISYFETAAREKKLFHALLFHGPQFVGKNTFALHLARLLEDKIESSQPLVDCLHISSSGDIGIDDIRGAQSFLRQKPFISAHRTVVIDGADTLTHQAANALLKTLEEPHRTSLIFLLAKNPDTLPATILSRVHSYYFASIEVSIVSNWLTSQGVSPSAASSFSKTSSGLPGLAWRLAHDEKFNNDLKKAEEFLRTNSTTAKNSVKEVVDSDDFSFPLFLQFLLLAATIAYKNDRFPASRVAKIATLNQVASRYNVSPRIQLTALLQDLQ